MCINLSTYLGMRYDLCHETLHLVMVPAMAMGMAMVMVMVVSFPQVFFSTSLLMLGMVVPLVIKLKAMVLNSVIYWVVILVQKWEEIGDDAYDAYDVSF